MLVLAWYPKQLVGYDAGMPCRAKHGLAALDRAVKRQCPDGARGQGVSFRSANGCQPTATIFMKACSSLGMAQAFTSDHTPQGMLIPSG